MYKLTMNDYGNMSATVKQQVISLIQLHCEQSIGEEMIMNINSRDVVKDVEHYIKRSLAKSVMEMVVLQEIDDPRGMRIRGSISLPFVKDAHVVELEKTIKHLRTVCSDQVQQLEIASSYLSKPWYKKLVEKRPVLQY